PCGLWGCVFRSYFRAISTPALFYFSISCYVDLRDVSHYEQEEEILSTGRGKNIDLFRKFGFQWISVLDGEYHGMVHINIPLLSSRPVSETCFG
ncbi:hypothetical protein L9F63_010283, partial [Diploptera punctata]